MIRTSNVKCRKHVQNRDLFIANNVFSEKHGENYYVFSYGHHWILFAYVDGVWYENSDKYSVTTSKHRSQAHPLCDCVQLTKEEIHAMY